MSAEVYRAAGELMADAGRLYGVAYEGGSLARIQFERRSADHTSARD